MRKNLIVGVLILAVLVGIIYPAIAKSLISTKEPPRQITPIPPEREPEPTSPLPESELTHIMFSKSWLLQNDEDERPEIIKITFPASWLNKSPEVGSNEPIALLRMPKEMLRIMDTNGDPNMITVALPKSMFKFYSNVSEIKSATANMKKLDERKQNAISLYPEPATGAGSIEYGEWVWFACDPFTDNPSYVVTRVVGTSTPYSYYNSGETFRSYHEREVYLDRDGDIIEFIADYTDSGNVYVWVAVFDEGIWSTPWDWLLIDVTGSLQLIEYYFFIDQGYYKIWLHDTKTDSWYYKAYDDTDNPSTRVTWLTGSSEIDTVDGISQAFEVKTYPVTTDWVWYDGAYHRPDTAFEYWGKSTNQPYVYVDGWFDSLGRIITDHRSASDEP